MRKQVFLLVVLSIGCKGDSPSPEPQVDAQPSGISNQTGKSAEMTGGSKQEEFDREFRGYLDRFREPLIASLREIIIAKLPAVIKVLSFEISADWRKFPVSAFAMDREAVNEVYFDLPFKGPLLSDAGPLIPKGAIDERGYQAAGVPTVESGARILAEWFGECWHAAGGARYSIPAYINLHDSSRYFDLRARRWVEATEIGN